MKNPFGAVALSASQYGSAAHAASHNVGLMDPLSVEIAFKASAAGPLVGKHDGTNGWKLAVQSNGTALATLNATTITAGTGLLDGEWHWLGLVVDRKQRKGYLFVDGEAASATDLSSLATLDSTAVIYLGKDGATLLTGSLSEFRLSACARLGPKGSTTSYTPPVRQFSDDLYTRVLLHMNEGRGTYVWDVSEYHTHCVMAVSPVVWEEGPTRNNPVTICRECLWLALDGDADLTAYLTSINGQKFRLRPGEGPPVFTADSTPSISLCPLGVEELAPETYGNILREVCTFALESWVNAHDIAEVEYLTHYAWRAVYDAFLTRQAEGAFFVDNIQRVYFIQPPRLVSDLGQIPFVIMCRATVAVEYRVPRDTSIS